MEKNFYWLHKHEKSWFSYKFLTIFVLIIKKDKYFAFLTIIIKTNEIYHNLYFVSVSLYIIQIDKF